VTELAIITSNSAKGVRRRSKRATAPEAAFSGAAKAEQEAVEAAHAAALRYVHDSQPGIRRRRAGRQFSYIDTHGQAIRDADSLARIKTLAVPPAWTGVWICASPNGHIQATGRDARGRKQYRYHPRWRTQRDETKFEHMLVFGAALPRIRKRVENDLGLPGLPREKVLAAVVRLMELTLARVGNQEYAAANGNFGLTTLHNSHVRIKGQQVELDFRAKHGIRHHSAVSDRKLARILKRCRDLPGSELFQYIDEAGERHILDSADLNLYLREISGAEITAKDFRTWAGTNLALLAIATAPPHTASKKSCAEIIRQVAERLGNTPTVCRKFYVHPRVLDSYLAGSLPALLTKIEQEEPGTALSSIERFTVTFLTDAR
jgi:DNA topoisomerase-1